MKRILFLMLTLSLLLTGCTLLDGEYHSVTPHAVDNSSQVLEGTTVSSYMELRDALVQMVLAGSTENTLYLFDIPAEELNRYMHTAIMHVQTATAVGAYAVEEIQYEAGAIGGREAVVIDISYLHGRQEIMRIKKVQTMNSMKVLIDAALNACDANVVIQVSQYDNLDVVQYVQDYVADNPQTCMEMPQVSVSVYPDLGFERVVDISFTYQTSRETLRNMQDSVQPIFSAAEMYVQGSEDAQQKYEQLYSFLMERFDYQYETSINPTYSLLRYGVGDCKAFASVYAAMCQKANMPCEVVVGTRNGEAWYWNMIKIGDTYHHLDLLASNEAGEFSPQTTEALSGYVWDYSMYP